MESSLSAPLDCRTDERGQCGNLSCGGYEIPIRNVWQGGDHAAAGRNATGGIHDRQRARRVIPEDNEWFTMSVAASGRHVAVWVNGYQTADYTQMPPANDEEHGAPIVLSGRDTDDALIYRNIRITVIPDAER